MDDLEEVLQELWYRTFCPHCQEHNETEEDRRGETVQCEVCQKEYLITGEG